VPNNNIFVHFKIAGQWITQDDYLQSIKRLGNRRRQLLHASLVVEGQVERRSQS
jgi:hypothetical protein